jgi:uncharacterized ubiquitin-like protein YukD
MFSKRSNRKIAAFLLDIIDIEIHSVVDVQISTINKNKLLSQKLKIVGENPVPPGLEVG